MVVAVVVLVVVTLATAGGHPWLLLSLRWGLSCHRHAGAVGGGCCCAGHGHAGCGGSCGHRQGGVVVVVTVTLVVVVVMPLSCRGRGVGHGHTGRNGGHCHTGSCRAVDTTRLSLGHEITSTHFFLHS